MTSEIAILNKRGIALAADSAVTLGGVKTTNSVNKLFTLDSQHSIGMMVFGNANIGLVPWEVIFKLYRRQLGNNVLDTVYDYYMNFLTFLGDTDALDVSKENEILIDTYSDEMLQQVFGYLSSVEISQSSDIDEHIASFLSEVDDVSTSNDFIAFKNQYLEQFKQRMAQFIPPFFVDQILEDTFVRVLNAVYVFIKDPKHFSERMSGIVIAGYGDKDNYPSLIQIGVDGFFENNLKYIIQEEMTISDGTEDSTSGLIPFAQSDVVSTLISGINPDLKNYMDNGVSQIHQKLVELYPSGENQFTDILSAYQLDVNNFIIRNFQADIQQTLEHLTLGEMGNMAETFINLTSFKREFSTSLNTVGGDCDVLIISKGDGPVWISRKMYFDQQLNNGYSLRRQ